MVSTFFRLSTNQFIPKIPIKTLPILKYRLYRKTRITTPVNTPSKCILISNIEIISFSKAVSENIYLKKKQATIIEITEEIL